MDDYRFKFLGKWWNEEDGFVFMQDPSVEIKRNFDQRTIYEKPYFDFIAIDEVYDAIETVQLANVCANLDFQIYKDGNLIWDGYVKTSTIKNIFNSNETGCVKEVQVVDKSYNAWIKSYEAVKIDVDNVFDLDCNITTVPKPITIEMFETTTPANTHERQLYRLGDLFSHLIKIITKGNVTFKSDWFTTGAGANIMMGNGEMIATESAIEKPQISFKSLIEPIAKYYNLWTWYYQENGKQYAKIEPYEQFFNSSKTIFKNVPNVEQIDNLEKLYATARVGDTQEVEDLSYANFKAFEFNNFRQQIVNVSNDCSWDTELDLTGDIVVDSDKINFVVTSGDPDGIYKETLFLIETDGTKAIQNSFSGISYYNQGLLNSSIIKRYYDGISPISVFPENYDDIDYFDGVVNEYTVGPGIGNFAGKDTISGVGETISIGQLRMHTDNMLFDFNSVTSSPTYVPSVSGFVLTARPYTLWTCQNSSNYRFELDLLLAIVYTTTEIDPVSLRSTVVHTNNAGTIINTYKSDYVNMEVVNGVIKAGGYKKKLNFTTPDIPILAGEKVYVRIENIPFFARAGAISIRILGGSEFKSAPCPNFKSEHEVTGIKNLYVETTLEKQLPLSEFNAIRLNPMNNVEVISNPFKISGYFNSIMYNYKTCETNIEMIGASKFKRIN